MRFTERGIDMDGIKKSGAELFPARWYKAGVRELLNNPATRAEVKEPAYQDFYVEILGAYNRSKNQAAQNLIVNTNGTVIKTSAHFDFQQDDEIQFLGKIWYVQEVEYDLTGISPQAAAYGDPLKNAITTLRIVALKRSGVGVTP